MKLSQRMGRGVAVLFTEIFFYLLMICPLKNDRKRSVEKQNEFSREENHSKHRLTQYRAEKWQNAILDRKSVV